MGNPKENKVSLSTSTCLSLFIINMLKHFIGEDIKSRKTLGEKEGKDV